MAKNSSLSREWNIKRAIVSTDQYHLAAFKRFIFLTLMRFILIIPAFLMFLSNIPFIHKMDKEQMMAMMEEKGCCKKKAEQKPSCHPEEAASVDDHEKGGASGRDSETEGKSCAKQEATSCVCVCCFQAMAPGTFSAKLHFGIEDSDAILSEYLHNSWKDPQLAVPWQPPDLMI